MLIATFLLCATLYGAALFFVTFLPFRYAWIGLSLAATSTAILFIGGYTS